MIALPWSMWLKVSKPDGHTLRLWLPLFLLWLVLLPILLLAFMITGVIDIALLVFGEKYHHYTLLLYRCLGLLGDARGMTVDVDAQSTVVQITIS